MLCILYRLSLLKFTTVFECKGNYSYFMWGKYSQGQSNQPKFNTAIQLTHSQWNCP